jgi:hypothetical protein
MAVSFGVRPERRRQTFSHFAQKRMGRQTVKQATAWCNQPDPYPPLQAIVQVVRKSGKIVDDEFALAAALAAYAITPDTVVAGFGNQQKLLVRATRTGVARGTAPLRAPSGDGAKHRRILWNVTKAGAGRLLFVRPNLPA